MIPDNNISENAQDSQENMKKGGTTTHTSDNLLMDEIINSASETYRSRHSDSFNSSRFLLEEAKIKKEKQLLSEYISAKLDNEQAQKLPLDFVDQLYLKMKSVEKKESAIIIKAEKDARKVANPPDKKVPYIKEIPFNPGTVNIVQGPSNAGKTNFVMYLAACITTGNKPFGFDVRSFRKDGQLPKILHLNWERAGQFTQYGRFIVGLALGEEESDESVNMPDNLLLVDSPDFSLYDDHAEEVLIETINNQSVDICIIDSLSAATKNVNENDSVIKDQLNKLQRVAYKTDCCFILLHHAGKNSESKKNSLDYGRGSSAIAALANTVINVSPGENETYEVRTPKLTNARKNLNKLIWKYCDIGPKNEDDDLTERLLLEQTTEQQTQPENFINNPNTYKVLEELAKESKLNISKLSDKTGFNKDYIIKPIIDWLLNEGMILEETGQRKNSKVYSILDSGTIFLNTHNSKENP